MKPNIWQRLTLPEVTQVVESSAAIQLVCPHCNETQTNSVIPFFAFEVHTCYKTYSGQACGKKFLGPGPVEKEA